MGVELVRDVMSSPAVTVSTDTGLKDATRLLARHGITALPVLDPSGALVGVISEADVLQVAYLGEDPIQIVPARAAPERRPVLVGEVMSRHPVAVSADTSVAEAVDLMIGTTVKSLPVVEHGHVVGVVSRRDLVRELARPDELVEAEIDELVRRSGNVWSVEVDDGIVWIDGPETEAEVLLADQLVRRVRGVVGVRLRTARRESRR
jgi:CBS domain-containing protein